MPRLFSPLSERAADVRVSIEEVQKGKLELPQGLGGSGGHVVQILFGEQGGPLPLGNVHLLGAVAPLQLAEDIVVVADND